MAAIDPKSLTVDYKKLLSVPIGDRTKLLRSGVIDQLVSALTPGQQASLFPTYYLQRDPDVGAVGGTALYAALSGGIKSTNFGGGTYAPSTGQTKQPTLNVETPKTPEEKALAEIYKESGLSDSVENRPAGAPGQYRPTYTLSDADLSDDVINTIAGEARLSNPAGVDAVINNMFNRLGTGGSWGPDQNLQQVARAPGQYAGYRVANPKEAEMIRERIRQIATGSVPDNTKGADSFRASYYLQGEGRGKTFDRLAASQGYNDIGGNVFAKDPKAPKGRYSPYSEEELAQAELKAKSNNPEGFAAATKAETPFDPMSLDKLDPRLKAYYDRANSIEKMKFEKAISKLGAEKVDEIMKKYSTSEEISKASADIVAKGTELPPEKTEVKSDVQKDAELEKETKTTSDTYQPTTTPAPTAEPLAEVTKPTGPTNSYKINEEAAVEAWKKANPGWAAAAAFVGKTDEDIKAEIIKEIESRGLKYNKELKTLSLDDPAMMDQLKEVLEKNQIDMNSIISPAAMATGGLKDIPPGEDKVIADAKTGNVENYINSRESVQLKVDPATLNRQEPVATFADAEELNKENPAIEAAKAQPLRDIPKVPNLLTDIAGSVYPYSPSFERALSRSNEMTRNHFGDPHMIRGA